MDNLKKKILMMTLFGAFISSTLSAGAYTPFTTFGNGYNNSWNNPYATQSPLSMIFRMRNSMLPTYNNNRNNNNYGNYNNYNDYTNQNYAPQGYNNTQDYNNNYNNDSSYNNTSRDTDIAYLLSRMEKKKFNNNYNSLSIDERLAKLENNVFGAAQSGDYVNRVNRLKQAFSAEANSDTSQQMATTNNRRANPFKSFFSSGAPTSIPVDPNYYSSLNDSNTDFYSPQSN